MREACKYHKIAWLILLIGLLFLPSSARAQAGTAMDLVNGVNNLRDSMGLAPYTVDNYLMGFAQTHSDYMASLGRWTHTRADGSSPSDHGIQENVAVGNNMSVQTCIYQIWADWIHWRTMTGYSSGRVGAGVAIADGVVYYTLNVIPSGSAVNQPLPTSDGTAVAGQPAENTPVPFPQMATSTPNEEGDIIHVVKYGETLWTISEAYDVPPGEIMRNNGFPEDRITIFEGQALIIRFAPEQSPTPTATITPIPNTLTPTPTKTPYATATPIPTPTPTAPPSVVLRTLGDGKTVGMGLILASGLGLILVIYLGFLKKS